MEILELLGKILVLIVLAIGFLAMLSGDPMSFMIAFGI